LSLYRTYSAPSSVLEDQGFHAFAAASALHPWLKLWAHLWRFVEWCIPSVLLS
jgi:hypothetical protein